MIPDTDFGLDPNLCLTSTEFMDSGHDTILKCLDKLRIGRMCPVDRATTLFQYVRDQIEYEFKAKLKRVEYRASYILSRGRGFCIQKAVLLCSLGRAAEIPTAIAFSDLRDRTLPKNIVQSMRTDILYRHGFNAFYLDNKWRLADASLNKDLVERKGCRLVEFDGTKHALLSPLTAAGKPHAEYLSWHGIHADLPFDDLIGTFRNFYANSEIAALN